MTRKEFLKVASLLGIQAAAFPAISSVNAKYPFKHNTSSSKVLIIGSGAAGLSAGYLLKKKGIDFTILEAASSHGGRMKTDNSFADFPISLGAEWVTSSNLPFNQLIYDNAAAEKTETIGYTQNDEYGIWHNNKLIRGDLGELGYRKFINSSWLHFFEAFILPSVSDHIQYMKPVHTIDYSGDKVMIKTDDSEFLADHVIVTVPPKILQNEAIAFKPPLPKRKHEAIQEATVWDGFKMFLEFREKFYPAFVDLHVHPTTDGQISYYDASFGQSSDQHILGLFAVGTPAKKYGSFDEDELQNHVLRELDQIFDGQATPLYIRHIAQNWSREPYIECAYLSDHENYRVIPKLQKPVDGKLFFAGDCYTTGEDWGNVHNAVESAKQSVTEILNEKN